MDQKMSRIELDPNYEHILISDELERYALLQVAGEQLSIAIEITPFMIITDKRINKIVAVIKE
jgi:hypothetical protein